MINRRIAWLCLALAWPGAAQITRSNIANYFGFENGSPGAVPPGWFAGAGAVVDGQVAHSGKNSLRIDRGPLTAGTFSTITLSLPLDFAAKNVVWTGWVRTENVNGAAAIWLREDGATPNLAFATTQGLNVNGTQSWTQYAISVSALDEGTSLSFGFLLSGTGRAWVDDLQLLADGVPVAQAAPRVTTPLDTDHEFDNGSKINFTTLSDLQVQNLSTLARVWGFLKYHHPAVTTGTRNWDYDLFRVMPQVLAAGSGDAALSAITSWIGGLDAPQPCTNCAKLEPTGLHLAPDLSWIFDEPAIGRDLSQALQNIHRNRIPQSAQFYVSLIPGVGNPSFDHERSYSTLKLPDAGYQLLALFRFWNMVQYFYPNRTIMSDGQAGSENYWRQVLLDSIPRIALAADSLAYQQEMMRFIARINDTHANLWSSIAVRPPIGTCYLPVDVRFVEENPVVLRNTAITAAQGSGLLAGDVIRKLGGVSVTDLVAKWTPLYADSNQAARLRDMGQYLTRGACGTVSVEIERDGRILNLLPDRVPAAAVDFSSTYVHDRPGDAFQMLSPDVAYLKLSSVKVADSARYIQSAAGTKGLIIDIRNYPSEFVVFSLGSLLVSKPVNFVRFTEGDVTNPGAFYWSPPLGLTPQQPHYSGKVVILVDEVTQSSAEYTTMAFRTAPGAMVIGSTTAGADGNVSTVPLPAGLSSYISGIGVFYPDNTPTQRVGIVPDIVVAPTIAGIRAGRDELLEEAIRQINWQPPRRRR